MAWSEHEDDEVSEGLEKYALQQVDLHLHLLTSFKELWDKTAINTAKEAVEVDVCLEGIFIASNY